MPGIRTLGVEIRRAMVTLDDSDGATRFEDLAEVYQGFARLRQVLQDKAGEYVIKSVGRERHGVYVGLLERHIPESGGSNALLSSSQRVLRYIHRDDRRLGTPLCQRHRLSTDAAPDFKDHASCWIERIRVQELG